VKFDVRPEQEIGPQLRERGIDPGDVRKVVLTHMHTDHLGGLSHFPDAEILVARREIDLASGTMGRLRGFLPNRWPGWFAPTRFDFGGDPLGPFPESLALTDAGDVRVVPTPGHTAAHVSVVLDEADTLLFFAGDTSYDEALMVEGAIDGVCPDPGAARLSLERIRELAAERPTVYLPGHDPAAAQRLEERRTVRLRSAR
jgi:glyoxylase-like metal-dependent hydrolase (beta-lactamase superfamily II)